MSMHVNKPNAAHAANALFKRNRDVAPLHATISHWLTLARHNQILFYNRDYLHQVQHLLELGKITKADVRRKASELVTRETTRMIQSEKHLLNPRSIEGQEVFNLDELVDVLWHHRIFKTAHASGMLHAGRLRHQLLLFFDCGPNLPGQTVFGYTIVLFTHRLADRFLFTLLNVPDFGTLLPARPLEGASGLRYVKLGHTSNEAVKLKMLKSKVFTCANQRLWMIARSIAGQRVMWWWLQKHKQRNGNSASASADIERRRSVAESSGARQTRIHSLFGMKTTATHAKGCRIKTDATKTTQHTNIHRKQIDLQSHDNAIDDTQTSPTTTQEPDEEDAVNKRRDLQIRRKARRARKKGNRNRKVAAALVIQTCWHSHVLRQHFSDTKQVLIRFQSALRAKIHKRWHQRALLFQQAKTLFRDPIQQIQSVLTTDIAQFTRAVDAKFAQLSVGVDAVVNSIRAIALDVIPFATIDRYGSNANGMALPSSDVDLVLSLEHNNTAPSWRQSVPPQVSRVGLLEPPPRPHTQRGWIDHVRLYLRDVVSMESDDPDDVLFWMVKELKNQTWVRQLRLVGSPTALVFKLVCVSPFALPSAMNRHSAGGNHLAQHHMSHEVIKVDMTVWHNSHSGSRAAQIVRELSWELPHLRSLVLVLKQLLFEHGLNDAYSGGLSSYALTLLVACMLREPDREGQSAGALLVDALDLLAEERFFSTYGVSLDRGFYELGGMEERQAELTEPAVIEDPVNTSNNVGKLAFRIRQVQSVLREALAQVMRVEIEPNITNVSSTEGHGSMDVLKSCRPQSPSSAVLPQVSPLRRILRTRWVDTDFQ